MVVTIPLSRLPEMAEIVVTLFAPELEGSLKEAPPKWFIFANLVDHMACEGLLQDLPRSLREMPTRETARNEVPRMLHQVATAMEKTMEMLRTQLSTLALFVSPLGMLFCWNLYTCSLRPVPQDVSTSTSVPPNLRAGQDDLRPVALSTPRVFGSNIPPATNA